MVSDRGDTASPAESIIEREFKRARPASRQARARIIENGEVICVEADGVTYKMVVGSDDDQFSFQSADGEVVAFHFPTDWLELFEDDH